MGGLGINYMFLFAAHYVPVWQNKGYQCVYQLPCLWKQVFWSKDIWYCVLLYSKHVIEMRFSIQSHWWYWVVSFILFYTQGFHFVHVCVCVSVFEWWLCMYMHEWVCWSVFFLCMWCLDRKRGGIWVLISHFGLGRFVALWIDKALPGHHWQLRSKQFPPLPQQAQSTEVHRNLCVSSLCFPPLPGSKLDISECCKPSEAFHIILRERERKDRVKTNTVGER